MRSRSSRQIGDFPARPESGKGNPEGAIERGDPRASALERLDRELMTKGKLHDCLLALTAEQGRERGGEDRRIVAEGSNHVVILKDRGRQVQTES